MSHVPCSRYFSSAQTEARKRSIRVSMKDVLLVLIPVFCEVQRIGRVELKLNLALSTPEPANDGEAC